MKIPDLLALKNQQPINYLQFAASQIQGIKPSQEDYFLNYNDECFVLADGAGESPYAGIAAKYASETAVWAYKLVRTRQFYWDEKKKLMHRIFRTTNLSAWKKQNEPGSTSYATSLDVIIANSRTFWWGHAGSSSLFHFSAGNISKLTVDHIRSSGELTKYIGLRRLGLHPQVGSGKLQPGDVLLLVTDGITKALTKDAIKNHLRALVNGQLPEDVVAAMLKATASKSQGDNATIVMVRRIDR